MFTSIDKALVAGIMAIVSIVTLAGWMPWISDYVTEERVVGVVAAITPVLVYFIPNRTGDNAQ